SLTSDPVQQLTNKPSTKFFIVHKYNKQRKQKTSFEQYWLSWAPTRRGRRRSWGSDEDTVSYQLRKVGVECPHELNLRLGEAASGLLGKGKHILAVDTTVVEELERAPRR
ncbi:MAG: hypothetical protein ACTSWF_11095, partial [Candidatus Freyarchaeota archaeon]